MFLSTYENKLDKKGRVSVPASFRSYLSNTGYNGIVCVPSFNVTFELSLASFNVPDEISLALVAVGATAAHEEPPYTFISFDELLILHRD